MLKYFITCSLILSLVPSFAQQHFGGIGAKLFLDTMGGHTMPCVQGMVPNSSADQNLKATDFIIKVGDVSCLDKSMEEVVGMIRGEVGTTVKITVADTKEGKHPREYDLLRGNITSPSPTAMTPPPVPVPAFNTQCEKEVAEMKKKGSNIIKTFPSDCGNYFFNFDAEKETYHIRVWTIADKNSDGSASTFSITARVFDNTNEGAATQITNYEVMNGNNMEGGKLEGIAAFNKPCVGVVNVQLRDDKKKCRAMYVVIYK